MKQSTFDLLFAIAFTLIGIAFIVWGALQLAGLAAYISSWSDFAGLTIGFNFIVMAWFVNFGRLNPINA